jgi:hypothetical protein
MLSSRGMCRVRGTQYRPRINVLDAWAAYDRLILTREPETEVERIVVGEVTALRQRRMGVG